MELWVRWSWFLVVLLYGSEISRTSARQRRQSDAWWRSHQPGSSRGLGQPASRLGSPRGNYWPQSVSGLGSSRNAPPIPIWDSRYSGFDQFRDLSPPSSSPIRLQCGEDKMAVTVVRDFYGNGKLVKASDLTLGSCPPTTEQPNDVIFQNGLQECGSNVQMTPDWLMYKVDLHYAPTVASNVPIIRSNPAVVPIQCYYPRHGNVSSNAIKPTWSPYSTTVTLEERLTFSLRLMNADWSTPRVSLIFQLGDIFYIEASLDTKNHEPMMLFVDSCVATTNSDVNSSPRYEIISNHGCLEDGSQADSSSVFVSPRSQANVLRFMVDAFRFKDSAVSLIFITCSLRAAAINQTPDPMNKACSYDKASRSWTPIEGPSEICQCCASGNCAIAGGSRMTWGSSRGRQRGFGKRDAGSPIEQHGQAVLGPLLVTGAKSNQISGAGTSRASRMSAGQEPLQLWVLVAIGSVSAVVVAVALTVVVKCLLRRSSHKESVPK